MEEQTKLNLEPQMKEVFSWTKYNNSQTKEKILFLHLLKELCNTIPDRKTGQAIFCICAKIYNIKSARRLTGELELCKRADYIDKVPHFNTVLNYLRRYRLTPYLHRLITLSSLPLQAVERKFCLDSTGFGLTTVHDRWSTIRQEYSQHHLYYKAHVAFGTLTNIATACKITDGTANDSPQLEELVNETAKNFVLKEFSADKAYSSRNNLQLIWNHGALPLIPFKKNATGKKSHGAFIWKEMYNFFQNNHEVFMKKYHLRSNAEAGFHMIKSRFGDTCPVRNPISIQNDLLAKVLCHNLCVLVQEIFLMGLDFNFAQLSKSLAQE